MQNSPTLTYGELDYCDTRWHEERSIKYGPTYFPRVHWVLSLTMARKGGMNFPHPCLFPQWASHSLLSYQDALWTCSDKPNWFFFCLFIYLFLTCWVFPAALWAFSMCGDCGVQSRCGVQASLQCLLCFWAQALGWVGSSSCSSEVLACRISSCGAWA